MLFASSFRVASSFLGKYVLAKGLNTFTSKNAIAYRCQKPRAAMSGLASSSLFDVSGKHSPVKGWSIGSVCTHKRHRLELLRKDLSIGCDA